MLDRLRQLAAVLATTALVAGVARAVTASPVVPYQADFQRIAGGRWIDRAAQVKAESGFNPSARSAVGAEGLAQFMPGTWTWAQGLGWVPKGTSPLQPVPAITAQHAYMRYLEARCGGELDPALGSYNAGLGNIRKAQVLASALGLPGQGSWLQTLPRVTGEAHAAETRGYITHNARYRADIRRAATTP